MSDEAREHDRRENAKERAQEIREIITPAFKRAVLRNLDKNGLIKFTGTGESLNWTWPDWSMSTLRIDDALKSMWGSMSSSEPKVRESSPVTVYGALIIFLSEEGLGPIVRRFFETMPYYNLNPEVYVIVMENGLLMEDDLNLVTTYAAKQREISTTYATNNKQLAESSKQLVSFIDALVASGNLDLAIRTLHSRSMIGYSELMHARGPEVLGNAGSAILSLHDFFISHVATPALENKQAETLFNYLSLQGTQLNRKIVSIPSLITLAVQYGAHENALSFLGSTRAQNLYLERRESPAPLSTLEALMVHGNMEYAALLTPHLWRLFVPEDERSSTKIHDLLIKHGFARIPVTGYEKFSGDLTPCFRKLIQSNDAKTAATYLYTIWKSDNARVPDPNHIAEMIIETGDKVAISFLQRSIPSVMILSQGAKIDWDKRPGSLKLSQKVAYGLATLSMEDALSIAYHLDPTAVNALVLRIIDTNPELVSGQLHNLHGLSREVAMKLHDKNFSLRVLEHRKNFVNLRPEDLRELMITCVPMDPTTHWQEAMIGALDAYSGKESLPVQLFETLVESLGSRFDVLVKNLDAFAWQGNRERMKELGRKLIRKLIKEGFIVEVSTAKKFFKTSDESYEFYIGEFGDDAYGFNESFYQIIDAIYRADTGPLTDRVQRDLKKKEVGVTATGKQGVTQFISSYRKTRQRLIEGTLTLAELENNVIRLFVKHLTRFGQSEWDDGDEEAAFNKIIAQYRIGLRTLPYGRRSNLKKTYGSHAGIKTYEVRKDEDSVKTKEFSKTFLERWTLVLSAIRAGYGAWKETASTNQTTGLNFILRCIEMKQSAMMRTLIAQEASYSNGNHPNKEKILFNIRLRITALGKIQTNGEYSAQNAPEILNALALFGNEFAFETVALITYFALFMHPMSVANPAHIPATFSEKNPTEEQISWVINFLNHTVGTETIGKLFSDADARVSFTNFIRTGALEEGLANFTSTSGGKTSLSFVADQGLLMGFSGHMGDACWTNEDLSKHPNKFAIAMIQNYGQGSKHERIVGSALMIEGSARDGSKLLIIRGLNPRENLITKLDVADFFNKFVSYARGLATASGRKLAITIDDHSGGSGTNRPLIQGHMNDLRRVLKRVRLANYRDATFNDYNIVNDCFYI